MCFTISTAGFRMNNLFVSAQLIYFLSPAADRLFYPLFPPMTLLNSSAAGFVTTKLALFVLRVEIKLWQCTGPLFPCCSNTKIFRQLCSIDQDSTLQDTQESGATRRTATGNGMIKQKAGQIPKPNNALAFPCFTCKAV